MSSKLHIPRKSIYRLSVYSRCLNRLLDNRVETVSSQTLAKAAGVKPAQLRKDLTYLGNSGRRGLGYNVAELWQRINAMMGTNRLLPVILVGVGNLGSALLAYQGFAKEGFEIVAAFDAQPERRRQRTSAIPIYDMGRVGLFLKNSKVKLAIIAVPTEAAQEVANRLIQHGVQGILNFSPQLLETPGEVMVNNVNLAIELENLAYFVR